MIQKFQQGGQALQMEQLFAALDQNPQEAVQQLIQNGVNPLQIMEVTQVGVQQKKIKPESAQIIQNTLLQLVKAAKHGAKLNYIKLLSHKCAEDEELVYFKKGGAIDCGCVKKAEKGTKTVKKDCGGAKFIKNGDKVCPKCGKVHKAGIGCAIAKFKAYKLGGGISFMLKGTSKGGVLYRFRRSTNDLNNGYKVYSDQIMMTHDFLGNPTYDLPLISAGRTIYVTPQGNDTIFYTNNPEIYKTTPKKDINQNRAKQKFYQLIRRAPIEGEEYRNTLYWDSNYANLDAVRHRALRGN